MASLARSPRLLALIAIAALSLPALAHAQVPEDIPPDEINPEEVENEVKKTADEDAQRASGWYYAFNLAANASLNHSDGVVGAADGLTLALGLLLGGELDMVAGDHEWQNDLNVEHQQTQTPVVDGFIKSADNLEFKSLYLYRIAPWIGPYARFKLQTSIFPGFDRRPDDTTLLKTDRDGNALAPEVVAAEESIDLTDGFEPLVLTESVGAFLDPFTSKPFSIALKLGLGGQQIIVGEGYYIADDDDTDELELKQLENANSLGAEFELELTGRIAENVNWNILTNLFYPFLTSQDTDIEGIDRLHTDIGAGVSVKLAKWLSLDYQLSAKKLPFVVDEWQINNQVLFTAGFSLYGNTNEGADVGGGVE